MKGLPSFFLYFLKTEITSLILFITAEVISLSETERNLKEGRVSIGSWKFMAKITIPKYISDLNIWLECRKREKREEPEREAWQMWEYTSKHREAIDVERGTGRRSKKQLEPGGQKVKGKLRHTTQLLCITLPMQSICKCSLTSQFTLAPSQ